MDFLQAKDVEAKIGTVSEKGCQLLLYKTARVDMAMLDKEYGAMNWQCDYKLVRDNMYCGIGVRDKNDNWVWKWDCGIESREDGDGNEKKGEASDAFKRAGFKWGIGVELYNSPFIWINAETYSEEKNGRVVWKLKDKFMKFTVKDMAFDENGNFTKLVIVDKKGMIVYELGKKIDALTGMTSSEKAKATREANKQNCEQLAQKAQDIISWMERQTELKVEDRIKVETLMKSLDGDKLIGYANRIAELLMKFDGVIK